MKSDRPRRRPRPQGTNSKAHLFAPTAGHLRPKKFRYSSTPPNLPCTKPTAQTRNSICLTEIKGAASGANVPGMFSTRTMGRLAASPSSFSLFVPLEVAFLFFVVAASSVLAGPELGVKRTATPGDKAPAQATISTTTATTTSTATAVPSSKDVRSSFARLLDLSQPVPRDWTFLPQMDPQDTLYRRLQFSNSFSFDYTFASPAPTSGTTPTPTPISSRTRSPTTFSTSFDFVTSSPSSILPSDAPTPIVTEAPSAITLHSNAPTPAPTTATAAPGIVITTSAPTSASSTLNPTQAPSEAITTAPSAIRTAQPSNRRTISVVTIDMDLAGTPEQQASTVTAITTYIRQILMVTAVPSLPSAPVPPTPIAPSPVAPSPSTPGGNIPIPAPADGNNPSPTPTGGGNGGTNSSGTSAPTIIQPPLPTASTTPAPTIVTVPATTPAPTPAVPTPSPTTVSTNSTLSPTISATDSDTSTPTTSATDTETASPTLGATVSDTVDGGRRRRLISAIRLTPLAPSALLSPAHRLLQVDQSNSSLCGGQQSTTTFNLEDYDDEAAVRDLLESIMNGTAVLPAVDNTTDVSDTICTYTATTIEVPVAPLDDGVDDNDGAEQKEPQGLSSAHIIAIGMVSSVAVLIIAFLIYRSKAIVMTAALTAAARSGSSLAVMDASVLSPSPAAAATGARTDP